MAITLRIIPEPPGLSRGQQKQERGKNVGKSFNLLRKLMLYVKAELTLEKKGKTESK